MTDTNPASILKQISQFKDQEFPPVHLWNPPLCENVEMRIDREGNWYFMNSPIGRKRMVCLLYTSPSPRDLSTSRMPSSA